jgi:hypothetical protein
MAEDGRTVVEVVDPAALFGGDGLESVCAVRTQASEAPIGVVFTSEVGTRTYIYNWGDELVLSHAFPWPEEITEAPLA